MSDIISSSSSPELLMPESLTPETATMALLALSQLVGQGEYIPETDDRSKRLKLMMAERDAEGNITKIVKGDPELIEYRHRSRDDSGATYPNDEPDSEQNPHTRRWAIDDQAPRVIIPDNVHHTGNPRLLPHVHETDRGKSILTSPAVKAHQSSFLYIPNFQNSPEAYRTLVGRNGNLNIKVTDRTGVALLYGNAQHPEWDLGDDTAMDLVIEDLAYEPRPPFAWNYAKAEAAKPYASVKQTVLHENGQFGSEEVARELKPDELKPSDLDVLIKIDDLVEYFSDMGLTTPQIRQQIRLMRDYVKDKQMKRIIKTDPVFEQFHELDAVDKQTGDDGFWVNLAAKIYVSLDERQNTGGLEPLEQQTLEEFKKIVDNTSHTGPDMDYRILHARQNAKGIWHYADDPKKALSHNDLARRQNLIKSYVKNGNNMAKYQATCAYEITKEKPYMQAALWLNMMQDQLAMGFTPEEISMVMIGLQYANKPLFLSFKHRYVQHPLLRDANGEIVYTDEKDKHGNITYVDKLDRKGRTVIDRQTGNPVQVPKRIAVKDDSKLEFGPLKLRDWATELSQRMPQHGMVFEPGELSEFIRTAIAVVSTIDKSFYTEGFEKGIGYDQRGNHNPNYGRLSQEYLDNLFAFEAIIAVLDNLSYGMEQDPSKRSAEELARAQTIEAIRHNQMLTAQREEASYPAKISASAYANKMLKTLKKIGTPARKRWPITQTTRIADNAQISTHDPRPGEYRSAPSHH